MSFYDFLEQFMFMGTVLESDQIKVKDEVEDDMYRSPDVTKSNKKVEMLDEFKSPTNSDGSPNKNGHRGENSTQGGSNAPSPSHLSSMKNTPGGKLT